MAKVITMRGLGAVNASDYGIMPSGFQRCAPPLTAKPYGDWIDAGGGWIRRMLIDPGNPLNYWAYYRESTDDWVFACQIPPSTGMEDEEAPWYAKEQKLRIAEMQTQLNVNFDWHPNYPLAVDGVLGPKTCEAAYRYQQEYLDDWGKELSTRFWTTLDLPAEYKGTLGMGCGSWHRDYIGGDEPAPSPAPAPAPEPEVDPVPVVTSRRNVRILAALLGVASGAVIGVAAKKQWYPRVEAWKALAAGGAVGLGGGVLFGAAALKDKTEYMAGFPRYNRRTNHPAFGPMGTRGLGYVPSVVKSQPRTVGALGRIHNGIKVYS